eukprot:m.29776 g.29776  ORF g.29776 m.29776 type:complete len:62 (+) comp31228_c0_seq3:86-271(+)
MVVQLGVKDVRVRKWERKWIFVTGKNFILGLFEGIHGRKLTVYAEWRFLLQKQEREELETT